MLKSPTACKWYRQRLEFEELCATPIKTERGLWVTGHPMLVTEIWRARQNRAILQKALGWRREQKLQEMMDHMIYSGAVRWLAVGYFEGI